MQIKKRRRDGLMGVLDPGQGSREGRAGDRTLSLSTRPPELAEAGYAPQAGPRPALPLRPSGRSGIRGRRRRAPPLAAPSCCFPAFLLLLLAPSPRHPGHVARGCGREGPSPTSGQTGSRRLAGLRRAAAPWWPGAALRCGPRLASSAICCAARGTSALGRRRPPPPSRGCAGCEGEATPLSSLVISRPLRQSRALGLKT